MNNGWLSTDEVLIKFSLDRLTNPREAQDLLDKLAREGTIERKREGHRTYYRQRSQP